MPVARPQHSPLAHKILYPTIRTMALVLAKAGWRLHISGAENVPRTGPLIVAPNHRSYADPPLVGVSVPREVHFLAKQELFAFRPFGWLIRNLNAHPLNRAGDIGAFREATRILKAGGALIVFPEGRRMKTDEPGSPKAGIGMLAVTTESPILPVYIHNSALMARFRRVYLRFGKPMDPKGFGTYAELASEVMRRIAELKREETERLASTKI
jgi:1-acyl-sn-glycerol-3-phosphate acyltransferase